MNRFDALLDQAKAVLDTNRLGGFTKPAPQLYPYQWNWDSGFIAMGYAHYNMDQAISEMSSLFSAQWHNGLLPQIIFHEKSDQYFPGPTFWQCEKAKYSPDIIETSGITMPPVHGFVSLHMLRQSHDLDAMRRVLKAFWPKIIALHEYLYNYRDPLREGLPHIRHPWEGGTDNSPLYDHVFNQINLDDVDIPNYVRKDLKSEKALSHRPHKKDYDLYIYLVDLFRKLEYDESAIEADCPFKIQDPLFIGILNYSNEALLEIGRFLKEDIGQVEEWYQATSSSIYSKLYNKEGWCQAFDMVSHSRIDVKTNSTFIPFLTMNQSESEKSQFIKSYEDWFLKEDHYACPTTAYMEGAFESDRYWRGPVWLNLNYLLIRVMERNGLSVHAADLLNDSLDLADRFGFFEYFDSDKRKEENGYGTDDFSWSAAIIILLIQIYKQ